MCPPEEQAAQEHVEPNNIMSSCSLHRSSEIGLGTHLKHSTTAGYYWVVFAAAHTILIFCHHDSTRLEAIGNEQKRKNKNLRVLRV